MDDFSIALIAAVAVLTLLAIIIVFFWHTLSSGTAQTNEPTIDALMRHALARPPLEPRGVGPPVTYPASQEVGPAQVKPSEANGTDQIDAVASPPDRNVSELTSGDTPPIQPEISVPCDPVRESSTAEPAVTKEPSSDKTQAGMEATEHTGLQVRDGAANVLGDLTNFVQTEIAPLNADAPAEPSRPADSIQELVPSKAKAVPPAAEPPSALERSPENAATKAGQTAEPEAQIALPASAEGPPRPRRRPPRAVYKDRRGQRRHTPAKESDRADKPVQALTIIRPPAEARLRLVLHPIHKTTHLSLVLARPEGFPEHSAIDLGGPIKFDAFNESRYDDIDIDWTTDTFAEELRFTSPDGFTWVRSARRVHIFSVDPAEAGVMSISAAKIGAEHTVVCQQGDVDTIVAIAAAAGSPDLTRHDGWEGIFAGWCVLSGYVPKRAVGDVANGDFRPLDPGFDIEIALSSALTLRPFVFAEGHSLRIEMPNLPEGVAVTIDGKAAWKNSSGAWEVEGWTSIGAHLIDLVPGPSLTYEIVADPGNLDGWPQWNAHAERFDGSAPWARTWVCGASVCGPNGETVIAHETRPTLVSLGSRDYATALTPRPDADVSVGLAPRPPAFLLVSTGRRRQQGQILWLGLETDSAAIRTSSSVAVWADIVRSATARRLPLRSRDSAAKEVWQRAIRRARALKGRLA